MSSSEHRPSGTAGRIVILSSERPRGLLGRLKEGLLDFREGLEAWRIWHVIGVADIRRRYARSRLGQLWLTLSTGILVIMYGFLFSLLFHQAPEKILPYITASFVLWSVIATTISSATTCLVGAHQYFQNQYASFSIAIFVVIYRALISLAHDIFVVAAVLIYFGIIFKVKLLAALLGFVLVIFTLTWASYVIAIVCVRYRDVIQVMTSVMQAAFFMTPVFWRVDMFPESYRHYLILNPFNVMLTLIRDPLLGIDPPADYWICGFAASAIGFLLSLLLIGKYRRRIVFWI